MESDAIIRFSDEKGMPRKKRTLRATLTDEQIEQVRNAREAGVTWAAIARYFREEHDISFVTTSYRNLLEDDR